LADDVDHAAVMSTICEDSGLTPRYAFMILMSAGIAVLGLLLSSPAVVIGAMLISPLMNPILGFGFSLATFDFRETRRSLTALAVGSVLAVAFTSVIVLVSPLKEATDEILSRTRPNLFDLLVALFAALAGTFAIIKGRGGTIVGVAIATALMPPLAVVGYGLATGDTPVLGGALALFVTNFITIALSAAVVARLYGFGHSVSSRQTWLQSAVLAAIFVMLAVPLGVSLTRIASETVTINAVRSFLMGTFGPRSRITQLTVDFDARPIAVRSVVITPVSRVKQSQALEAGLEKRLGRQVILQLDQVLLAGASNTLDAQRAHLKQVDDVERAAAGVLDIKVDQIRQAVAAVAGISADQVSVDREQKRVMALATPLPGADLQTYRALEQRVETSAPQWRVELIPPPQPLPLIHFRRGSAEIDAGAQEAVLLSAWAAKRWNIPMVVVPGLPAGAGSRRLTLDQRRASAIAARLKAQGLQTRSAPSQGRAVRLRFGP
jgi:uncharacterized hydrophobic protein (TIGR00271 family)